MKHKRELLALAKGLRTVPDESFNLLTWLESPVPKPKNKKFNCGYVGCAIGWFPVFVPKSKLKLSIFKLPGDLHYRGIPILKLKDCVLRNYRAVSTHFGMSPDEAVYLFSPHSYNSGSLTPPNVVADRIEQFVKDNS